MLKVIQFGAKWHVKEGDHTVEEFRSEAKANAFAQSENALIQKVAALPQDERMSPLFIPLVKVDVQKRQVWGWASQEVIDHSDEIMDYDSSLPYFEEWSRSAQKRSGGRSLGNLRAMHKNVAAGKLIEFRPEPAQKGFWVGAEVVDDAEWNKVQTGVYTGFSVGGSYVRRWYDPMMKAQRYTAKPAEISLVDAPCVETARFQVIKADGSEEAHEFSPGKGENELAYEEDVAETPTTTVEDIDLDKVLPSSPEPAGGIAIEGGLGADNVIVEKLPEQDLPMQVSPTNPPASETLADRHVGVEDLTAEAAAFPLAETTVKKIKIMARPSRLVKVVRSARRLIKVVSSRKEKQP